jgi:2-desacetyl-2-hydroxyethyl bacteriochlorophyllide A dehydrogenase
VKAKQILIVAPRRVEVAELDVADGQLGPTEVIVRTRVSLLSGGTEGAFFQGLPLPGRERPPFPYPTGYANVGEVLAVGGSEAGVAPGDLVYTMSRHCSVARVDTARQLCVRVPAAIPAEAAVFVRLMTVPLTTVRTAAARAGDRAAVVGLGLVGNLGAQVLRAAGMAVTGVDLLAARRELARRCGVEVVVDPRDDGAVHPEHRLVLEATGTARGAVTALALAQLGGEVSLVGTPWVADPAVPASAILEPIHMRFVTVRSGWEWQLPVHDVRGERGAIHQPGSIEHGTVYALELLARGAVQVLDLVTHRYAPADCQTAYERAVDRKDEQLGALFLWDR